MGRFAGIKQAQYNEGGIYFLPGLYLVHVDRVKTGTTRKGIDFFVVESTIVESDNGERKPGSACAWMVTLDKDAALGNIKHFCSIATGCKLEEVDEAGVEMIVSDENPLRGTFLRVQAVTILTKEKKEFTKVTWRRYDGDEQVAARKLEEVGAAPF